MSPDQTPSDRLRVLVVEDAAADAELALRELGKGPWEVAGSVVDDEAAFLAALSCWEPDVILCDYTMPRFDGLTALRLAKERAPQVPFIMVTGSINEETAVACMKAGAWDYLLKENLGRLVPAVSGALDRARLLREHEAAQRALSESEARYRLIAENTADVIWTLDIATSRFTYVSPSVERLRGWTPAEVMEQPFAAALTPGSLARVQEALARALARFAAGDRSAMTAVHEVDQPTRAGGVVPTEVVTTLLLDAQGRPAGLLGVSRDIGEQRIAEQALRRSEEKYRLLVEGASEAIVVTQDGVIRFANQRTAALAGRAIGSLVGSDALALVHPDDAAAVRAARRLWLVGEPVADPFTFRLRTADSVTRWVELRTVPIDWDGRPATLNFVADVTERRQVEERVRLLAAAVEQAAETVVITDIGGRIVYANPAFERTTGYTLAEALGRNPRVLKSGAHPPEFYAEMWSTLRGGGSWTGRFFNRRKDGSHYQEDATISPVRDEAGEIAYFVAVKRDVTHELALRQQLEHAQRMEAVGRLAGGVAHDFNNVLQAMLSHVGLLRMLVKDERPLASVGELTELVRRGSSLTRQLLLFSRRETAKLERIDLGEVVREAMGMLRRLVRADVRFDLDLDDAPLPIRADRGQVDQVLMNLVVNASDAMPAGGAIVVSTGREGDFAALRVDDSGPGVPVELRSRIFEPFYTTKSKGTGTGLGLSVVHGIVLQHGGIIEVGESSAGGAHFSVRLPLAASGDLDRVELPVQVPVVVRGSGESVLIVEDEEAARAALVEIVCSLGYVAVGVGSGEEAAERAADPPLDVLLTDLVLPGINGLGLARRLGERWPRLRVILMSGYTEDEAARQGVRDGNVRFLQKPFDTATLARELHAALASPPPG